MTEMPKTMTPQVRRGDGGEGMHSGRSEGVELVATIAPDDHSPSAKILQEKAKGSNSIEHELSVVN